ncbi:fimbrial biogenesis chaperone [Aeromonas hydrophila]|uniref:fimbrial biogenesis chaperone n=1 Tax=Aeromonas hydrophila TaxID=644 RepID=UPI0009B841CA|nr:molecular chaperone [Aeromonas hydrophila]
MKIFTILFVFMLSLPQSSEAKVQIVGTRFILHEGSKVIKIKTNNLGDNSALVQAWIDNGNMDSQPYSKNMPMRIYPPIIKISKDDSQIFKVISSNILMRKDRESVFWVNFLEIPPKNITKYNLSTLGIAVRTRMKVFYRPKMLNGSPYDAVKNLKFSLENKKRSDIDIVAINQSPYYVNINDIIFDGKVSEKHVMLPPFSKQKVGHISNNNSENIITSGIHIKWLNDYGVVKSQSYQFDKGVYLVKSH